MLLQRGQNNTNVPLTLVEKTTISSPYYLFEFQNDTTKVKYYQIFTDVSAAGEARDRSNLFDIEVITSGTALANQIKLGTLGQYNYTIYEQASSSNLDPALSGAVVQRGRAWLIDDEDSIYVSNVIEVNYFAHEQ